MSFESLDGVIYIHNCNNTFIKYSKSLIKTVRADKTKQKANVIIHWTNNITGNHNTLAVIPIPEINNATKIIIQETKKFIAPLITIEIGKISLGKYTFFNIPPLPTIIDVLCEIVVAKKFHGINAENKNIM